MRDDKQHILFVATEYDAPGMRPYAQRIINAMWQAGDRVLIVSRYGADNEAFGHIPPQDITWIDYPQGLLSKGLFRFWPTRVMRAIDRLIEHEGIQLIYSLTEELILAGHIGRLQQRVPVLYTVHDARFHDYSTNSPVRWLKNQLLLARPQRQMMERTVNQLTNSREQQELLEERYPSHQVHYAPFPTLVSTAMAQGTTRVEELKEVGNGYILFFGTLHLYKGVHLLYDAYLSHPELHGHQLVIAGTSDIYFDLRRDDTDAAVTVINRYIDDSEIKDLFSRAAVVVYPYISATQSGVISIASYFGKPMVLSDLPFFRQTCDGHGGVQFFPSGDPEALAAALERALSHPSSSAAIYQDVYSSQAMQSALDQVIASTLNTRS